VRAPPHVVEIDIMSHLTPTDADASPDDELTIHIHEDAALPRRSLFSKPLTVTFLQDGKRSKALLSILFRLIGHLAP